MLIGGRELEGFGRGGNLNVWNPGKAEKKAVLQQGKKGSSQKCGKTSNLRRKSREGEGSDLVQPEEKRREENLSEQKKGSSRKRKRLDNVF